MEKVSNIKGTRGIPAAATRQCRKWFPVTHKLAVPLWGMVSGYPYFTIQCNDSNPDNIPQTHT